MIQSKGFLLRSPMLHKVPSEQHVFPRAHVEVDMFETGSGRRTEDRRGLGKLSVKIHESS